MDGSVVSVSPSTTKRMVPEQRDGGEPECHDRAERPADPRRPLGLDGKQRHEVTRQATDGMRSRGSGSQRTLCWRGPDSNHQSRVRKSGRCQVPVIRPGPSDTYFGRRC